MRGFAIFIEKDNETFYLAREGDFNVGVFTKDFLKCFLFHNHTYAKEMVNKLVEEHPFEDGYVYKIAFVDCAIEPLDAYVAVQHDANGNSHLVTI